MRQLRLQVGKEITWPKVSWLLCCGTRTHSEKQGWTVGSGPILAQGASGPRRERDQPGSGRGVFPSLRFKEKGDTWPRSGAAAGARKAEEGRGRKKAEDDTARPGAHRSRCSAPAERASPTRWTPSGRASGPICGSTRAAWRARSREGHERRWRLGRSSGSRRRMGGAGKVAQHDFLSSFSGKKENDQSVWVHFTRVLFLRFFDVGHFPPTPQDKGLFIYLNFGCTGSSLLCGWARGGYSWLWGAGFSLWGFLLLPSTGSGAHGCSICGSRL